MHAHPGVTIASGAPMDNWVFRQNPRRARIIDFYNHRFYVCFAIPDAPAYSVEFWPGALHSPLRKSAWR
jgi:hypothetical protein